MNLEEARSAAKQHAALIQTIRHMNPVGPSGYLLRTVEIYGEEVCYVWTSWDEYHDQMVTSTTLEKIFSQQSKH